MFIDLWASSERALSESHTHTHTLIWVVLSIWMSRFHAYLFLMLILLVNWFLLFTSFQHFSFSMVSHAITVFLRFQLAFSGVRLDHYQFEILAKPFAKERKITIVNADIFNCILQSHQKKQKIIWKYRRIRNFPKIKTHSIFFGCNWQQPTILKNLINSIATAECKFVITVGQFGIEFQPFVCYCICEFDQCATHSSAHSQFTLCAHCGIFCVENWLSLCNHTSI